MKRIIFFIFLLATCFVSIRAQITGHVGIGADKLSFSKQDGYDVIRLAGSDALIKQVGAPELPVVIKTFVIPSDAKVSGVDVIVGNRTELNGTFMPFPAQPPVKMGDGDTEFVGPDETIYNGTAVYPGKHAEIVSDRNEMGYHLVTIQLYPLEFDPAAKKLYISNMDFTLRYETGVVEVQKPLAQSGYRTAKIKKVIKAMVDNPQDVERFSNISGSNVSVLSITSDMVIDATSEQVPDYIIITNGELESAFQRLAKWKIQKGLPAVIKKVEEIKDEYIGSDLAEKIHAYLQECRNKWGDGLSVLLGGDTNVIPPRMYKGGKWELYLNYPTDCYYADLGCDWNTNKNNLYAEKGKDLVSMSRHCYVGRAPVENLSEANLFVNKVLAYEKMDSPDIDKSYLMNHMVAKAYIDKDETTGKLSDDGQKTINGYFSSYPQLRKWYLFDHYNCDCSKHDPKPTFTCGEELNKTNFLSALNDGGNSHLGKFHIVYHADHCSPRLMGTSSLDKLMNVSVSDVDNLSNGNYQQIIISGGCTPAQFDRDCIAEHFLNNPNGGAVAFIGNANSGYEFEYSQYKSFLDALYKSNITTLGPLLGKMIGGIESFPSSEYAKTPVSIRLHLLGDPEMPVWSAVPQNLAVSVSSTTVANGNSISVKIDNLPEGQDALVCLMKDGEGYLSTTISDRNAHNFIFNAKTNGDITVTVTAHNFFPYVTQKAVDLGGDGQLSISSLGTFNKSLAIGDSASFRIAIKNTGTVNAEQVTASLSSSSPYVKVINGNVNYGAISAGSVGSGNSEFKIAVRSDAPEIMRNEWNAACLNLTISRIPHNAPNSVISRDTFHIDMVSPRLRIANVKITSTGDGDKIPEAGEQVVLSLESVRLGKQTSNTPRWVVANTSSAIDRIISVSDNSCTFKISNSYKQGSSLTMKLILMDGNVAQDSVALNVAATVYSVKTENVHWKSENNAISLYWESMGNSPQYNIYRSGTETGTYVKLNKMPLTTRYFEDADISIRAPFYYKLSALTEQHLEGPLSDPVMAISSFPMMLQQTSIESSGYSCESYTADIDLDGKKEIVQTSSWKEEPSEVWKSVLVALRPDGTEPYDIDGNATSFSGYAKYDWLINAVPTVADLRGNGEMSVLTFARDTDSDGKYYAMCHSALDKNGDNLPDTLWKQEISGPLFRGAVVTDINKPDGKDEKEIIFAGENNGITILNADGTQRALFGNEITSCYCGLAVADLDGNGYKEIICGNGDNLYVWNHDGTPFRRSPFFTRSGMNMKSSPVVCDLDNDGEKEILVASRTATSYIFAIKLDGTCVGNFDSQAASPVSIEYPTAKIGEGLDHAISVGDINADGNLEVVALGKGFVRVWSNTGTQILNRPISGLLKPGDWDSHFEMPLLADVDGDSSTDIVFSEYDKIYAIHTDGTDVMGFPISLQGETGTNLCISDIDGDGKNEIIATDVLGYINVWKTEGTTIEWGRSRFDQGLTGEYVSGYQDPKVITADKEWTEVTPSNDIYVRSGTLRIPSLGNVAMKNACKLVVLNGGALEIDGGTISNADILIKDGGRLTVKNNGKINIGKDASLNTEVGALVDFDYGEAVNETSVSRTLNR